MHFSVLYFLCMYMYVFNQYVCAPLYSAKGIDDAMLKKKNKFVVCKKK